MRIVVLSLAAAVLTAGPTLAQAVSAEDVLKKAIEAHGGADVLSKYTAGTQKMRGVLTLNGADLPFTGSLAYAVPGKVRLVVKAAPLGQKIVCTQIINGDKVVQLQNGQPVKISDTVRAALRETPALQEISLVTPLLDKTKYALELGKDVDVDGKLAYAVVVKAKGRRDITLYFDAKSGLLVKMRWKTINPNEKEVTEVSTFSDYRKIAGMVVPMKINVMHDGLPYMEVTVTDHTPLEKIDDKEFVVPEFKPVEKGASR